MKYRVTRTYTVAVEVEADSSIEAITETEYIDRVIHMARALQRNHAVVDHTETQSTRIT